MMRTRRPSTVCGALHPETLQRCTKLPGHYPGSKHSNERPGHEISWDSDPITAPLHSPPNERPKVA